MNQKLNIFIEVLKDFNDLNLFVETNDQSFCYSMAATEFPVTQIVGCENCGAPVELEIHLKTSKGEELQVEEEYLEEVEDTTTIVQPSNEYQLSEDVTHDFIKHETEEEFYYDQDFFNETDQQFEVVLKEENDSTALVTEVEIIRQEPTNDILFTKKMCHICSVLINPKRLNYHLQAVHKINISEYKCNNCSRSFKEKSLLKYHLIEKHFPHLSNRFCDFCGKGFASKYQMTQHIRVVHSVKKPSCPICLKGFNSIGNVNYHIQTVHRVASEKTQYSCSKCGKIFLKKSGLTTHAMVHMKPEEYKVDCKMCGKVMAGKYKLNAHMKLHTEGPPTCEVCGKTFNHKSSLKEHINIHTGEKPYECKICFKKFGDRSNLRTHLKGHEMILGVKLTLTSEERRLMQAGLIEVELDPV